MIKLFFDTIKYINIKHNKNISVIYTDSIFNKKMNFLLKNLIIGTQKMNFKNLFVFTNQNDNKNQNFNFYLLYKTIV